MRAQLRVIVKRILRKYDYPPDKQEKATQTVLEQAEELSAEWRRGMTPEEINTRESRAPCGLHRHPPAARGPDRPAASCRPTRDGRSRG
ncbi:MAG TPA: type I restriction enzyme endonuclease domain-containing protein [Burkholderiales bacterium]|nr:type I restriction enzyme endonuclease domain-containing protein [Burkholderiales bacterium]